MTVDLPISGHCLCGQVRFELVERPRTASYCHCTRCQRRTGNASSAQARVGPGAVRILAGEELVRTFAPPDGFHKLFCSNCGSALFSRAPDSDEIASVRLGLLDGDHGIRPEFRQHVDSAAGWEPIPDDGLPRYPGSHDAGR
jgi:hypothetical protein